MSSQDVMEPTWLGRVVSRDLVESWPCCIVILNSVKVAVVPSAVVLAAGVVPLVLKFSMHRLSGQPGPPAWLYPVDVALVPVACIAMDLFGIPGSASDSFVGRVPGLAWPLFVWALCVWLAALLAAVYHRPSVAPEQNRYPISAILVLLVMATMVAFCTLCYGRPLQWPAD